VDERTQFEHLSVQGREPEAVKALARALRAGGSRAQRLELAAAFAHVAFLEPGRIAGVYDAASEGWFGVPVSGPPIKSFSGPGPVAPPPAIFWDAWWDLVDQQAMDAGEVTSRTAALGGHLDSGFAERGASACLAFAGVKEAAQAGMPGRFDLSTLAACPRGSVGDVFHRLIVENGFDLEVLDRDALGLSRLIQPLGYLNARMLQTHDLWHILAGYRTTGLHEIGISGFQMAQFGHGYSAMFLALVATKIARAPTAAADMITEVILSGWAHGRRTPPMLLIPWEEAFDQTPEALRRRYGVRPYETPYPADIFEQFRLAEAPVAG